MLIMAYYMIQRREPYRDAGADFFDRLQPEDTARRLVKRLMKRRPDRASVLSGHGEALGVQSPLPEGEGQGEG
jgi:hypothetical protein